MVKEDRLKLKAGKIYTTGSSGLIVRVEKIYFYNEQYVKMKLSVFNKSNHAFHDTRIYKSVRCLVDSWVEVKL